MWLEKARKSYGKLRSRFRGSKRIEANRLYCLTTRPVIYEGLSQESFQIAVDDLQAALVERGLLEQSSGVFDEATRIAVEQFQECNCLRVDGIVGGLTWAALMYPTLSRAKTSSSEADDVVRELQKLLRREKLDIKVDGSFGWETALAVKRFQRRYGLHPDGVCGPMTWSVLLGQRPEWDAETGWCQWWWRMPKMFDQLAMVVAVHIGIHFSPVNGPNDLPFVHTFVTAYGLICVASPFLEAVCTDYLEITKFPLLRFSPYVLAGFLSRQVLVWILGRLF